MIIKSPNNTFYFRSGNCKYCRHMELLVYLIESTTPDQTNCPINQYRVTEEKGGKDQKEGDWDGAG